MTFGIENCITFHTRESITGLDSLEGCFIICTGSLAIVEGQSTSFVLYHDDDFVIIRVGISNKQRINKRSYNLFFILITQREVAFDVFTLRYRADKFVNEQTRSIASIAEIVYTGNIVFRYFTNAIGKVYINRSNFDRNCISSIFPLVGIIIIVFFCYRAFIVVFTIFLCESAAFGYTNRLSFTYIILGEVYKVARSICDVNCFIPVNSSQIHRIVQSIVTTFVAYEIIVIIVNSLRGGKYAFETTFGRELITNNHILGSIGINHYTIICLIVITGILNRITENIVLINRSNNSCTTFSNDVSRVLYDLGVLSLRRCILEQICQCSKFRYALGLCYVESISTVFVARKRTNSTKAHGHRPRKLAFENSAIAQSIAGTYIVTHVFLNDNNVNVLK